LLYYVNQPDSLENIVREIRQEAYANGLTSEILQALLNDEKIVSNLGYKCFDQRITKSVNGLDLHHLSYKHETLRAIA
jgi:hypothetical protein